MNKQKGNMYGFVTHTWNPIRGKCPHDCVYCYMKVFKNIGELRLDEKALKDDLGSSNFIFVGSSTDMFAKEVNDKWIEKTLQKCKEHNNKYLFQTKNTDRMAYFVLLFPKNSILGVTLESDKDINVSKAPPIFERFEWIMELRKSHKVMVSIEPIINFNLKEFVNMIYQIKPEFVSIGADSKRHNLQEPSKNKINLLIKELKTFTEVKIKDNLKRLTG